jgi:hypothetical protein
MTFFPGNAKNLLIKKQVNKDTPITDFSDALNLRVYEWSKLPARVIDELQESDSSSEQGPSHVSGISPGFSFGIYGRPLDLAAIAEAILGNNDDSSTVDPTTHTASADNTQPYYSVMEVIPYGSGEAPVYDGCRFFGATFQSQDDGSTELQVTGIEVVALGLTHGGTIPDPLPAVSAGLPFIHAELAVKYATVHLGTTKAFSWQINRNGGRRQGDSGFRAIDATPGKLATSGSFSRYTADDTALRSIDTGDEAGTDQTSTVETLAASILFTRGSGASLEQFLIAAPDISFETRDEALNLDGTPFVEVLGFRTQPQGDLADHISIVTVNSDATTGT